MLRMPKIGDMVYYTDSAQPEAQAAIITGVTTRHPMEAQKAAGHYVNPAVCTEGCWIVDLHVFQRTGDFYLLDVPFAPFREGGCWSWPPQA